MVEIRKIMEKGEDIELVHKLIYIPFGTGVILPATQLHAGHYGSEHDQQFHAVLSRTAWKRSYLQLLEGYIKTRLKQRKAKNIYLEFNDYENNTDVKEEMESAAPGG